MEYGRGTIEVVCIAAKLIIKIRDMIWSVSFSVPCAASNNH